MYLKRPSRNEGLRGELRQYIITDEPRCLRAKGSSMQSLCEGQLQMGKEITHPLNSQKRQTRKTEDSTQEVKKFMIISTSSGKQEGKCLLEVKRMWEHRMPNDSTDCVIVFWEMEMQMASNIQGNWGSLEMSYCPYCPQSIELSRPIRTVPCTSVPHLHTAQQPRCKNHCILHS